MISKNISVERGFSQANILSNALEKGYPVALWKLPGHNTSHLIVDLSGSVKKNKIDLENGTSGFAISPFINPSGEETLLIENHLHFKWDKGQILFLEHLKDSSLIKEKENFLSQVEKNAGRQAHFRLPLFNEQKNQATEFVESKKHYTQNVSKAIEAMQGKLFQKVVLSRRKRIELPDSFHLVDIFHKLSEAYPNAFVYFFYAPGYGAWMGATPEILISVDNQQIFRTIALAGTQPFMQDTSLQQVTWNQKEIEEQAMVCRYIINCFKKIRLREYEEDGPKTMIAGNLIHLRTNYIVDMKATGFPQLGTIMLELLHPTSAVCGMPKEAALDFILREEGYDRQFYSGFSGPVNIEEESHLFVNLRCMQLFDGKAFLYAGAGITENSLPEREWNETEIKSETLLKVIF